MLGIIFSQFREFTADRFGADLWLELRSQVPMPPAFSRSQSYPDEALVGLLEAAVRRTGVSRDTLLTDFGRFLAPALARTFQSLIDPTWTTLDLLEHTERVIHEAIRERHPQARPPLLACRRERGDEVILVYESPRRLCALAKGIARGVAEMYGEPLSVEDLACMDRGEARCRISFRTPQRSPSGDGESAATARR